MSAYVFVSVAGGSLGLLAGGLLTEALSWHWVFFVNLPIGRRRVRARPGVHPRRPRARARARRRLARLAARHRVAHERHLRDRRGNDPRLDVRPRARHERPGRGSHGRVHRARGAHREPDHAAAHPPCARADQRERRPRLPGHGDVLHVLPRHALPRARPPLQPPRDGRGLPPVDAHRRGALPGHHRAARRRGSGRFPVLTTGMATAAGGLLLFATVGPDTAYFPTVFVACFAIGLGIGNAFMPLLTLAMANVPAADAGLGSGITNVSQQISGALGLAVLSTVAADHTQGLLLGRQRGHKRAARRLPRRLPRRRRRHRRRDRPRRGAPASARTAAAAEERIPARSGHGGTSRMTPSTPGGSGSSPTQSCPPTSATSRPHGLRCHPRGTGAPARRPSRPSRPRASLAPAS